MNSELVLYPFKVHLAIHMFAAPAGNGAVLAVYKILEFLSSRWLLKHSSMSVRLLC